MASTLDRFEIAELLQDIEITIDQRDVDRRPTGCAKPSRVRSVSRSRTRLRRDAPGILFVHRPLAQV